MAMNAFFVTTVFLMALAIFLLGELEFLVPYKALLLGPYAGPIAAFAAALFVNVFAVVYLIGRTVFLKDTGRKLAHLEKQLRTDRSISEELAERLGE
jgi:hypothetical protein